jgi:hypothetical protein
VNYSLCGMLVYSEEEMLSTIFFVDPPSCGKTMNQSM